MKDRGIREMVANEAARLRRIRHEGKEQLAEVKRDRGFFSRHANRDGWFRSRDDDSPSG
jgi:hypothetical protein